MRKFPKKFTGTSKLVGPLNLILEAAKDRTPLAGDGIKIDQTPHGCRISATARPGVRATPIGIKEMVVVSEQPDFLVCKEFTRTTVGPGASYGDPDVVGDTEIVVAKDWQFRRSAYSGRAAFPGILDHNVTAGNEYYLDAASANSSNARYVYSQPIGNTSAGSRVYLRTEDVWPPFSSYEPGSASFDEGTIITVAEFNETIMTVSYLGSNRPITRLDISPRAWIPRSQPGTIDQYSVKSAGASGGVGILIGNRVTSSSATGEPIGVSLADETILVPSKFRRTTGSETISGISYSYSTFGLRTGRAAMATTASTVEWQESITPPYQSGDIISVARMSDGKLIDLNNDGRSWQVELGANWYCTPVPDTQIIGRFTAPTLPV